MDPNINKTGKRRRTSMADERFARWLAHIYETATSEMDCSCLQFLLPAYVEQELGLTSHLLADGQLAAVYTHLEHCPDCMEEYQGLREVVALESDGKLPEPDEILTHLGKEPAVELAHRSR
jgi:hypothetical protein